MSDLIRRDDLLKKECCGRISGDDVREAPAVDAVEVVRCKDCEFCRGSLDPRTKTSVQVCGVLYERQE